MIPPVLWLYSSSFWSATYLLVCFAISAWNGATFQIEVSIFLSFISTGRNITDIKNLKLQQQQKDFWQTF